MVRCCTLTSAASRRLLQAVPTPAHTARPQSPKAPEGELELGILCGMTDATPGFAGKANFHVKF